MVRHRVSPPRKPPAPGANLTFSPCAVILVNVVRILKELEFFISKQLAKRTQPHVCQRIIRTQRHEVIDVLRREVNSTVVWAHVPLY